MSAVTVIQQVAICPLMHMHVMFLLLNAWTRLTSGPGSVVGMYFPKGWVSRALPKMEVKYRAMVFCCSMVQWFSKDKITGYGEV